LWLSRMNLSYLSYHSKVIYGKSPAYLPFSLSTLFRDCCYITITMEPETPASKT
jgi:hypothetical protein